MNPCTDALLARLDPEFAAAFPDFPPTMLHDLAATRRAGRDRIIEARRGLVPNANVTYVDHNVLSSDGHQVLVREYSPAIEATGPLPAFYWIHGGGHIMGAVENDDLVMEHIVETVQCRVFSVEWRWSPEAPFPAPLDDCEAGLLWLVGNAAKLGIDPARIALGGASSGGGSAAGLALRLREAGKLPVCFQLLIYPMLDDRNESASSHAITDERLWSRSANITGWRAYLAQAYGTDEVSPYAAPARAQDLHGLPPTYLAVGDLDLFLDEDIDYARRLAGAGVPTEMHVYSGAVHGFYTRLPDAALSRRFINDWDAVLQRVFGQQALPAFGSVRSSHP